MINQPAAARPVPWLTLFAVDFAVTAVTLVAFGLFGGFMLIVALNGFSGDEGLRIMIVYALLVVAGNASATCLFNWLNPARARGANASRAAPSSRRPPPRRWRCSSPARRSRCS